MSTYHALDAPTRTAKKLKGRNMAIRRSCQRACGTMQEEDGMMHYIEDLPPLALSVRQPWAWSIIFGGKDIENRSRAAVNHGLNMRGRICIHASKGMTRNEYEVAASFIKLQCGYCPRPDDLTRGGIIGSVDIVDVVRDSESPWFFGQMGLVLKNAKPITSVPAAGALGLFKWTRAGDFDPPKAWMTAWPNDARRQKREMSTKTDDLFKNEMPLLEPPNK